MLATSCDIIALNLCDHLRKVARFLTCLKSCESFRSWLASSNILRGFKTSCEQTLSHYMCFSRGRMHPQGITSAQLLVSRLQALRWRNCSLARLDNLLCTIYWAEGRGGGRGELDMFTIKLQHMPRFRCCYRKSTRKTKGPVDKYRLSASSRRVWKNINRDTSFCYKTYGQLDQLDQSNSWILITWRIFSKQSSQSFFFS